MILILMFVRQISTFAFNQLTFCPNASWNSTGITFANSDIVGSSPWDIFITKNNTIYIPNRIDKNIVIWSGTNLTRRKNISLIINDTYSIFVTEENEIYFDYAWNSMTGIGKLTPNLPNDLSIVNICSRCHHIFIDSINNIYCSVAAKHQVIKRSLHNVSDPIKVVAGTGGIGRTAYMLNAPHGLFVDTNFDLYVADYFNDRVQMFPLGQSDGITVAGSGSSPYTILIYKPTGVILDGNKYVFVVDHWGHRIVGSGLDGFRCLVGCNSGSGSAADQLTNPHSMSFDIFGNMFVVDQGNNRIQKFILLKNSCNETATASVIYLANNTLNISTVNTTNSMYVYNQPKLDPYSVWNPNAITFADTSIIGTYPYSIFIDTNNTVYVPDSTNRRIRIWMNGDINPKITIYTNPIHIVAAFVTSNGNIYTTEVQSPYQIKKWTLNSNKSDIVMYVDQQCNGTFIDIRNTLYCSIPSTHKVVTKSLTNTTNILTIVAGTGCAGSNSNTLNYPYGIFVDTDLNLYVADFSNHRIQLFQSGIFDGITIVGSASVNATMTLNHPMSITFDMDKYLFIVEYGNNRIVGSGPNGYRCIVGCTGSANMTSNTLFNPTSMVFDSYGNMYVTDHKNHRIQKFLLLNKTLTPSYNQPKFCSNATWNSNAITFANITVNSYGLFIDTNDTVYYINNSKSIFVTINGDIYVDNSQLVISAPGSCYGLFIDITNTLYCSVNITHQVLKKVLDDNTTVWTTVAGIGSAGSTSNMLWNPNGIFVDTNFDLYVADSFNNRIQLFRLGNLNGITVAGATSINITTTLNTPSNVILDGNKYLFIADTGNNRIIRSDQNSFYCIIGCTSSSSSTLRNPHSIAFDSLGNLFVVDTLNHRIQKFILSTTFCRSSNPCDLLDPCQNQGICMNTIGTDQNYFCQCKHGFDGNRCQYDHRLCTPNTCWNNGICNQTSNTTYECLCQTGWTGDHCEIMINYCNTIKCENNGVCQGIFMNYTCQCLSESFSGRHCEQITSSIMTQQRIAKSFAYTSIIFIVSFVIFIIVMDILKYFFGIDSVKSTKKSKQQPVIQRFVYVIDPVSVKERKKHTMKFRNDREIQ